MPSNPVVMAPVILGGEDIFERTLVSVPILPSKAGTPPLENRFYWLTFVPYYTN